MKRLVAICALALIITVSASSVRAGPALAIGDVNCDGGTNSIDAALVLQKVGGLLKTLPCADLADVNDSGSVNAIDASLILQFTARRITSFDVSDAVMRWRRIEDEPHPELPGKFVDLPRVYAVNGVLAHYGKANGPNTNAHVSRRLDYSVQGLPPAGGPHWGMGSCGDQPTQAPAFCGPVPWGIYREEWQEESVVHNLEHGGVVVWYNSADSNVLDQLEEWVVDEGERGAFVVLMPYSGLPNGTVAMTAWARRDVFPVDEMTEVRVKNFIQTFVCRFNPEGFSCNYIR